MARAGLHLQANCQRCGKEYRQSRSDQRFCSTLCSVREWRKARRPVIACARCGLQFAKFGQRKYCSKSCAASANAESKKRTDGPGKRWALGKQYAPRQTCEVCGVFFYATPSLILRGGGKFCSKPCKGKFMARFPPLWRTGSRTRSKGGKRADLGDIYFRSSWEANYARYLNWLKSSGNVKEWFYEPDTFEFPVKKGSRFYTPDFRIHWAGTLVEYHEVKGYMDPASATKIRRMRKYHPEVSLRVIDKKVYRALVRDVVSLIPMWEGPVTRTDRSISVAWAKDTC